MVIDPPTHSTDSQSIRISVITVVLNDAVNLQHTISNVLSQTWQNIEYIIVDGGSTDGSLEIIRSFGDKISKVISGPDNGIYDAMNKGIRASSGKFLHFMNCGDGFVSDSIIWKLFHQPPIAKIIYGDSRFIYPDHTSRIVKAHPVGEIWKPFFNHQAAFFQRDIFQKFQYDVGYAPAADFHLLMQCRAAGFTIRYTGELINDYLIGGDVFNKELLTVRLYFKINRLGKINPSIRFYYWKKIIWVGFVSIILKQILPLGIFLKLQRWFRNFFPE